MSPALHRQLFCHSERSEESLIGRPSVSFSLSPLNRWHDGNLVARLNFVIAIDEFHARAHENTFVSRTQRGDLFVDRKSTRLNSSHEWISYAVFCLKKKKKL